MEEAQVTRVLAIRHGETAWNVDTRIQGQLDIPLNDTGRWQAHRLALAVAEEGLDAIYASDLLRAVETAQAVARGSGREIVTDTGLRERGFGAFEGLTFVVTGTLPTLSRGEATALIEAQGGRVTSGVSRATSFVVVGEEAGSKLEKAVTLGITTLTESELLARAGTASGR